MSGSALGGCAALVTGASSAIGAAGAGGAGMEGVDYKVSKVGLQVWTKTFARDVVPSDVRVNCVACGAIDTPMHAPWRDASIEGWGQTLHASGGLQGSYA